MYREKKFAEKVRNVLEVNVDFDIWNGNVFKVVCQTQKIAELINPSKNAPFVE